MPTLKQLSCQIEWAGSNVPFKEYGTVYGDGYVECYIAIPNSSTPFSINLRSDGYIAAGLAMFVLMDGVYQCNRNRDDLRQMGKSSDATTKFRDVNFRVRQREERLPNGGWVGRPWRFAPFQLVKSPENNRDIAKHFERLGTIQVVVLRCAAHPRANITKDDDISDGTKTPESGMAPGSEDDGSISSEESLVYENHNSRFQEGNEEIWGAFRGLFDGPYDSEYYVQKPPNQHSYPGCCLCHRPGDNSQAKPFGYTHGHIGGSCQNHKHSQQQPAPESNYHTDLSRQETIIDAPDIPPCGRRLPGGHNLRPPSGCCMPRPNLPVNIHENYSHLTFPSNGYIQSPTSSGGPNMVNAISNGEDQGGSRFSAPPIVLNISPHICKESGHSHGNKHDKCPRSDNNGYYVISDGKRVPESSSCGWRQHNSWDGGAGVGDIGRKKSRRSRRRSRRKDMQEGYQADSKQQDEGPSSEWNDNKRDQDGCSTSGNNEHQRQDRCGVDGEATPRPWAESNQADNTNNVISPPGDWDNSDGNHRSSSWNQNAASSPKTQSFVSLNQHQEPPTRQTHEFDQFCVSQRPVFVSPMVSEWATDEPPLYTVPESVARAESLTHQVQLGPQARYTHRIRTPEYLDTMDKPYAEFIFKYRTAGESLIAILDLFRPLSNSLDVIQNKFDVAVALDIDEERRKLEALPRFEIVNQLLRAQGLLSTSDMNNNRSPRPSPPAPLALLPSPTERTTPMDSLPNMNGNLQNPGNGNRFSCVANSPPCPPPGSQRQQSGSGWNTSTTFDDCGGGNEVPENESGHWNSGGTNEAHVEW
ncbi:conserved hypothetical protein [Histoplasma capsulatum var. duboisii H88]|uniref:Uncharacterized protein n=1 Tax=Ajellomyces capsulatus (strain H88) TaxID=544711 RepID=F0UD20_AJEC8|nr:conserved hypothetical protein [Histoplasma capsulatum var. duboisii H88]